MPQPNGAGPASAVNGSSERELEQTRNAEGGTRKAESGRRQTPTAEQAESTETSGSDLAEFLNLPAEARQAISQAKNAEGGEGRIRKAGKQEGAGTGETEEDGETPNPAAAAGPNAEEYRPTDEEEAEEEGSHDADDGEETAHRAVATSDSAKAPRAPKEWPEHVQKIFNKKVGKLWRQRGTALQRAAQVEQALQQAYAQIQQLQSATAQQGAAAPRGTGMLGNVQSEQQLDRMVAEAENVIEMVEANPDGLTVGSGANERFVEPSELGEWKRKAEAILRNEPRRREQLKAHAQQIAQLRQQRAGYDAAAQEHFPALFDETSEDYATAVQLLREAPVLAQHPAANFILGMMVDWYKRNGKKAEGNAQRSTSNGQRPAAEEEDGEEDTAHRAVATDALDRRLTPEHQRAHIPPLAPTAPRPPTRNGTIANRFKDAEKVAERFTRPGGGSTADLADMLRAIEPAETKPGKPKPVSV